METKTFTEWLNPITIDEAIEQLGVKSTSRKREVVYIRWWFWRMLIDERGFTMEKVGKLTGHDHSTVVHGMKMTSENHSWLKESEKKVREVFNRIVNEKKD